MSKRKNFSAIVYSTNPDFKMQEKPTPSEDTPPAKQKLYVSLDRKQRGGKVVTLVEGFLGSEAQLETLGRDLKSKCGTGGSAKDGLILIQGDFREKVMQYLSALGFQVKQKGG